MSVIFTYIDKLSCGGIKLCRLDKYECWYADMACIFDCSEITNLVIYKQLSFQIIHIIPIKVKV